MGIWPKLKVAFPNLSYLDIADVENLSKKTLQNICKHFPALKSLKIGQLSVSVSGCDTTLDPLIAHKHLEALSLSRPLLGLQLPAIIGLQLPKISRIRKLSITCGITDAMIAALSSMPQLAHLILEVYRGNFSGNSLQSLMECSTLTELHVWTDGTPFGCGSRWWEGMSSDAWAAAIGFDVPGFRA